MKFLKVVLFRISQAADQRGSSSFFGTSRGLSNVIFEGKNSIADRCNFSGDIQIGYATTLGYNNVFHGCISIGKYCQVGFDVALHATNHPSNYLSTYINKNLFDGELKTLKENNKIIIVNDVWIGHNAIVVGNVTIGNGAIIAAGAVVTKDVAAYTVVGGVPAQMIKERFNKKVIDELQELKWWDKSEKELEKIKPLFFKDLSSLETIYEEK